MRRRAWGGACGAREGSPRAESWGDGGDPGEGRVMVRGLVTPSARAKVD